jgi:DcmR-like sensory protein
MRSDTTECGLSGVGSIAYGLHMCHFYRDREELVAALVPFFAAGLRNNERCIWITAEPLSSAGAKLALRDAYVDVDEALSRGSLVVRDYADWYSASGETDPSRVARLWFAEEERALAEGYAGLRITGNTSFLTHETWRSFMDYEALLNKNLQGRRIVTLCSYAHDFCGALQVAEVLRHHNCSVTRPNGGWRITTAFPA